MRKSQTLKAIFFTAATGLMFVFAASIVQSLRTPPDEECDFCRTTMVQFDAIEINTHSMTYYECPNCKQRGERSVNKTTGLAKWMEW